MKNSKERGFSLIEVLVAVTVVTVIAAAVYSTFRSGIDAYRRIEEHGRINQNLRNSLRQISRDIRCAYLSPMNEMTKFIGKREQDGERFTDTLEFATYATLTSSARGGLQRVRYEIDSDPITPEQGLIRVNLGFPAGKLKQERKETSTEVSEYVASLKIQYFDGKTWKDEWGEGKTSSPSLKDGVLPRAVKVVVMLVGPGNANSGKLYETVVPVLTDETSR
ncbi:MAG: type II secretion system protein GspJ [Elusimicrobiota bacterium]